jgi:hypothetical protein
VRLLAVYEAQPEARESVLSKLRAMLDAPATASCPTLQLVAGLVFLKASWELGVRKNTRGRLGRWDNMLYIDGVE